MSQMLRWLNVSFIIMLGSACGDGESRKRDSSSGGIASTSPHSGGVSVAGEASTSGQSNGGSFSVAGNTSASTQSGGVATAGKTTSLTQTGGVVSTGGSTSSGGTKSTGGASVSIAGGGVISSGGTVATGGTKTVPCTTPLCQCAANVAGAAGSVSSSSLMSIGSLTDYSALGYGNYQKSQSGFGIYCSGGTSTSYRTATIGTLVGSSSESEIDVTYSFVKTGLHTATCECDYVFSDWFSLRRQFTSMQSLCGSTGILLEVKGDISKPRPEAGLRITIADAACKNADGSPAPLPAGGTYPDELWWYDIAQTQVSANWTSLHIPFNQLRLSSTRTNDGIFDPRCIMAFEINYQYNVDIWCGNGCSANDVMNGSGHFEIKNLRTY